MSAPFGNFRPGEAGFIVPAPQRTRPSVGALVKLTLALVGVSLVPALALGGTFALLHRYDRPCPAPVDLRGSIAPERELAILEPPTRGRP